MTPIRHKVIAPLSGLLLLIAMLAAYSNHFHNDFHFDDGHTIVNNGAIRDLGNIPRFFRDATTFSTLLSNQSYRPLVSTLLAIDYRLGGGLDPFWFHVSSFAIFFALTLLVGCVTRHLLRETGANASSSSWIALAAAGCYGLHPANADPVNYIIVSAELMAALGVMGSFAIYFAFPRLRRYFVYLLPAALAILAKPTAAIFPLLLAALRFTFPNWNDGGSARTKLLELIPPILICGAMLWLVRSMTPQSWISGARNPGGYLLSQPFVAWLYFKTFFWPTDLSADYDLSPLTASDPRVWIGVAFVIFLAGFAIVAVKEKRTRLTGFGLLWFLIALLPTSLFPLAEVMNDYRALLSYIGLVVACAGAATLFLPRLERQTYRFKLAVACLVILALSASAYATFQRNRIWKSSETLWHDVVEKSPRNGRGLVAYGLELDEQGRLCRSARLFRSRPKIHAGVLHARDRPGGGRGRDRAE
jgi:hypothetical protein